MIFTLGYIQKPNAYDSNLLSPVSSYLVPMPAVSHFSFEDISHRYWLPSHA